jgi:hypothetical protein
MGSAMYVEDISDAPASLVRKVIAFLSLKKSHSYIEFISISVSCCPSELVKARVLIVSCRSHTTK